MAGLLEDLIEILNSQYTCYDELLVLSVEKRNVIVRNDTETLQKITMVENKIVNKNQKLELHRLDIMKDIANVLNKDYETLDISTLAELIKGQSEYDSLMDVKGRLKEVITDLKDVNEHNTYLLQSSMDYINFTINLVRTSLDDKTSYHSSRKKEIMDERGFFDAKQ